MSYDRDLRVIASCGLTCLCTGNDLLHFLTSSQRQRLRVDLADFENNTRYAEYDNFTVGSASTEYNLTSLGQYNGNAGENIEHTVFQNFMYWL